MRSNDGVIWTVADIEPDSAGGVVWKVDNAAAMTHLVVPWDVGGFGPTGWIFEFAEGYTGFQITPPRGDRLAAQRFEVYHSPDGQDWSRIEEPDFVVAGYDHFEWRVGFAHRNGVALLDLSNADPRDPLRDAEYRMWRSDDGITWRDITPRLLNGGGVWALGDVWLQGPAVLTGDGVPPRFLMSADGVQWEQAELPDHYADFQGGVRVTGNKIFIFGEDRLLVGSYTP